jgi:guanylate kinase
LDLKGASKIKRLYPKNTVTIFVMPPSLGALRERIKKRCEETKEDEIRKRLKLARREMLFSHRYDYCLVNKGLADTARNLKNIVLRKIKEGV